MENDQTKDESKGFSTDQKPTALWKGFGENKKNQMNIASVLADHGYSLESVIGAGRVSTIWFGKFDPTKREFGNRNHFFDNQTTAAAATAVTTTTTTTTEAAVAATTTILPASSKESTTTTTETSPKSSEGRNKHAPILPSEDIASETTTTTTTTTSSISEIHEELTSDANVSTNAPTSSSETLTSLSAMTVAMKVSTGLTNESRKFLQREMSIWKELQHPNVVTVFEVFDLPQGCCIAMEATALGDLLDHIQSHGYFPEIDAKRIFQQIISAVDYLHERDLAHRDLKCENVLMFGEGKFKLTDFGFARSCRDPTTRVKVLSETFCGSVPYAAPEVLEGSPYNPKYSDVWSLGVMLYVMLYGCLPLPDENALELLHKAKDQDIFFPEDPDVSDRAIDLMLMMMEPDVLGRATVRDIQRSPWISLDESSNTSLLPPSIIIQGKPNIRDSYMYDLVTDQMVISDGSSSVSSKEDGASSGACYYLPSDTAAEMTRKLKGDSVGDSFADWSRGPNLSSSSSSCESGKQQTQRGK